MLKAVNITKRFDDNIVLENFSHNFTEGKVTAIVGKSGCGKTTLLNILMGLVKPDSGEVTGKGKISAVFQENRLCDNLTVSANIRLVTGKNISKERISEELSAMGLDGCENQPANSLSGGMKRRVALIRALLAEYDVLFLDEPFKGLDFSTKEIVINRCQMMFRGKTVILVTHDTSECDRFSADIIELTK